MHSAVYWRSLPMPSLSMRVEAAHGITGCDRKGVADRNTFSHLPDTIMIFELRLYNYGSENTPGPVQLYCWFRKTPEWTPVTVHLSCYIGFLLTIPSIKDMQVDSDDDTSSEEMKNSRFPQSANVCFSIVDGTPGLHITTRNTSKWTPIATRTM